MLYCKQMSLQEEIQFRGRRGGSSVVRVHVQLALMYLQAESEKVGQELE
jgi:hypothetical protein